MKKALISSSNVPLVIYKRAFAANIKPIPPWRNFQYRLFSGETISRDVRDLDKARESQYFAHEDYEALKRLAKKARTSADEKDPTEAKRRSEHEKQELRKAVGPHLSDGDLSKILAWFHKSGTGTRA